MRKAIVVFTPILIIGTIIGLFTFFVSCVHSPGQLPLPDQLAAQGVIPEDADAAALRRGRALAITECSKCHQFYWPRKYLPESWPDIIKKNGERAGLSGNQIRDLELYFVAASQLAHKN